MMVKKQGLISFSDVMKSYEVEELKILLLTSGSIRVVVVVVVVAHIYPPVTGQRQTLSCWTISTLFITRTTS